MIFTIFKLGISNTHRVKARTPTGRPGQACMDGTSLCPSRTDNKNGKYSVCSQTTGTRHGGTSVVQVTLTRGQRSRRRTQT